MSDEIPDDLSELLRAAQGGDAAAGDVVWPVVYQELRTIASSVLRRRPRGRTMQTTALVHELYLKLAGNGAGFEGERHFYLVAAAAMRQIVIDYARGRGRKKRRAAGERIALDDLVERFERRHVDLIALDEALGRLALLDERKARVVELRFFAGLDIDRTAELLGVGHATVERDWRMARAWLKRELADGEPEPEPGSESESESGPERGS